jgi:hypothetical protein
MTMAHTLFTDLFTYVLLFDQTHLQGEFRAGTPGYCGVVPTGKRDGKASRDA